MVKVEIDSIRVSLMSQDRVVVLKDVDLERRTSRRPTASATSSRSKA